MLRSLLKFHELHSGDERIMRAYQDAIVSTVEAGGIVVDLGAGTGVLSCQACAAGARAVHAVEPEEIIHLVPRIAAANGFQDRIIAHHGTSFQIHIPEPSDVMIASMIDSFGIDNNLLAIVKEARGRLVKPDGVIIPESLRMSYCPVELPEWYQTHIDCWNKDRLGFRFQDVRSTAVNQFWGGNVTREALLASPCDFDEIRLMDVQGVNVAAKGSFPITRPGVLHALAGWCEFRMTADIRVSNSPLDENRLHWSNCILPLERSVAVTPGETVEAGIRAVTQPNRMIWIWDVVVRDSAGAVKAEFHQSTFQGLLLNMKDFAGAAAASKAG